MSLINESAVGGERGTGIEEWNLLLAGSCTDVQSAQQRLGPLLERAVDWDTLLRLSEEHGTSSLLYQNLSDFAGDVPAEVLTSLRRRYESNLHKSLFLARELFRILDCLGALRLDAIPYKGIVLSEAYYDDMALRQVGDMDLFVRRGDVARIKDAVRDLGYTPRIAIPAEAEMEFIAAGYECTFDSPAGKNLLEVQWALEPRFYAVDFDMEGLFERAVDVTVAGRTVKTPSPEDLLLVLSVHAAKHVWGRLIWICDIEQILKRGRVNWDLVQRTVHELGIERILHITLLLAKRFTGAAIPKALEAAVRNDRAAHSFADRIAADVTAGTSFGEEQVAYFRLMMQLRERPGDRWKFLTRLAFTPGPGEWEAVRLPKALFPLYRVVRLARLAARFASG